MFEKYKAKALKEFEKAKSLKLIDKKILPLLEIINKSENYYTTSSCSGRITLDIEKEKKKDHIWLIKTHKTITLDDLKSALLLIEKNKKEVGKVYLKVDSFILHIGCRDLNSAEELLKKCKEIGLKRTGIIQINPRILIEVLGLDRLSFLIYDNGFLIKTDEESLKKIVNELNRKLIKNWERIEKLKLVLSSFT